MGLGTYITKRHFAKTPEPSGTAKHGKKPAKTVTPKHKLRFVVQEHHASTLHYDFRLELDGVLKSWAVPKGPSLDPHEHHLAIHVEDHPYEYRTFEGVIPEGNYGAGNVIIWDEGTYEPRQDADAADQQAILRRELAKGHLTFVLHGSKLKGEFALIKLAHATEKNAWLLIKKGDAFASTRNVIAEDTSVKSGLRVDDLGAKDTLPDLSSYPKKPTPWTVHPMLCTLVEESFDATNWLFEIKWDGYRAIGSHSRHGVQLYSRTATDFMDKFPPLAEALHNLKHDVILDGEIVAVDEAGAPHFEWLQNWRRAPQGHLQYCVFDILWCDGRDVRTMPLLERKKLLKIIVPTNSPIHYSDHVLSKGVALFKEMQHRGLEGIVAKHADSAYGENERGQNWLKIKTHLRQEVIIGGFTEPRGSRTFLGSLLVGVYQNGQFVYVGHSGGGITDEQRKTLRQTLDGLERKTSPFAGEVPKPDTPIHWVKPELVCEMNFSEWTSDGLMRQPKYVGLRGDKKPNDVHREKPKHLGSGPREHEKATMQSQIAAVKKPASLSTTAIEFTHLDKVFFPAHKYTKGDLIHHYESVADFILPYLKDRPLSLLRQPGGVNDHGFFQKNMTHVPDWVPTADIYSDSTHANLHWMVGGNLQALLYAVQLGSIEINPWNSRTQHLDKPDWAIIDLDPEGVTFKDVVKTALVVKAVCDEWHIPCYPKTSGKTGIHIFIPMHAKYTYEQVKNLAHLLALEIHQRLPDLTSVERMPDKRKHRIYLDFLQNRESQTLAAPYSVRPTPDATVSTPLHWDEVTPSLQPTDFTIANIGARLKHVGDLWQPVLGKGIDISTVLRHAQTQYSTAPTPKK